MRGLGRSADPDEEGAGVLEVLLKPITGFDPARSCHAALSPDRRLVCLLHAADSPRGHIAEISLSSDPAKCVAALDAPCAGPRAVAWCTGAQASGVSTLAVASGDGVVLARVDVAKATASKSQGTFVRPMRTPEVTPGTSRTRALVSWRPPEKGAADEGTSAYEVPYSLLFPGEDGFSDVVAVWSFYPDSLAVAGRLRSGGSIAVAVLRILPARAEILMSFQLPTAVAAPGADLIASPASWALLLCSPSCGPSAPHVVHVVDCRAGRLMASVASGLRCPARAVALAATPDLRGIAVAASDDTLYVTDISSRARQARQEAAAAAAQADELLGAAYARSRQGAVLRQSASLLEWHEHASTGTTPIRLLGASPACLTVVAAPAGDSSKHAGLFGGPRAFVWLRGPESEGQGQCCPVTREAWIYSSEASWRLTRHRLDEDRALVLRDADGTWHSLSSRGIGAVLVGCGQTQQRVIDNLITFERAGAADALCEINMWDRRALRVHALEYGLRYKQLDVIEPALNSLEGAQQLDGVRLVVARAAKARTVVSEEDFALHLISIGLNFLSVRVLQPRLEAGPPELMRAIADPMLSPAVTAASNSMAGLDALAPTPLQSSSPSLSSSRDSVTMITPATAATGEVLEAVAAMQALRGIQDQLTNPRSSRRSMAPRRLTFDFTDQAPAPPDSAPSPLPLRVEDYIGAAVFERWRRMEDVEIMREALIGGHVPSVVGYLRWSRRSPDGGTDTGASYDNAWMRRTALTLVYQALCEGSVPLAEGMLCNAGIPVAPALAYAAKFTARRDVRAALLAYLRVEQVPEELLPPREVLDFVDTLESLLPSGSFVEEYQRQCRMSRRPRITAPTRTRRATTSDIPPCVEVDDVTPALLEEYGFEALAPGSVPTMSVAVKERLARLLASTGAFTRHETALFESGDPRPLLSRAAQGGILWKTPDLHVAAATMFARAGCMQPLVYLSAWPEQSALSPWAAFFCAIRDAHGNEEKLLQAGIANAAALLGGNGPQYTLESICRDPLVAPDLAGALSSAASAAYPTLARALVSGKLALTSSGQHGRRPSVAESSSSAVDLLSSRGDIALSTLLGRKGEQLFKIVRALISGLQLLPSAVAFKPLVCELGLAHFIQKGNAYQAYEWLKSKGDDPASRQAAIDTVMSLVSSGVVAPGGSQATLTAAGAVFLELCNIDSLPLRVDAAVSALFRDASDTRDALERLKKLAAAPVGPQPNADADAAAALAAPFCRVRALPLDTSALERHAMAGDWASFLCTAELQHFDAKAIARVLATTWKQTSPALYEHLALALSSLLSSTTCSPALNEDESASDESLVHVFQELLVQRDSALRVAQAAVLFLEPSHALWHLAQFFVSMDRRNFAAASVHLKSASSCEWVSALASRCCADLVDRRAGLPLSRINDDPTELVCSLCDAGRFADAASLASLRSVDVMPVHVSEARARVARHRSSCLWPSESERLLLWARLHKLFLERGASAEVVGSFFQEQIAHELCTDAEEAELLSLAHAWFAGRPAAYVSPRGELVEAAPALQRHKTPEALHELEVRIVLLRVGCGRAAQVDAELAVDKLLGAGDVASARAVSQRLSCNSASLATCDRLVAIARSGAQMALAEMEQIVCEAGRQRPAPGPGTSRRFDTILADFRAATELSVAYDEIVERPAVQTATDLVRFAVSAATESALSSVSGTPPPAGEAAKTPEFERGWSSHKDFGLASSFVRLRVAEAEQPQLAESLATEYFEWVRSHCRAEEDEDEDPEARDPRYMDASKVAALNDVVSSDPLPSEFKQVSSSVWSRDRIAQFVSLTAKPADLGKHLMAKLQDQFQIRDERKRITIEAEAEVLVTAYFCYETACDTRGCQAAAAEIRARTDRMTKAEEFPTLVRLLTGTRAYTELQYIFDLLIENGRFELLLAKESNTTSLSEETGLQGALLRFLKGRPDTSQLLRLVYLRFGMFYDMADALNDDAAELLRAATPKTPGTAPAKERGYNAAAYKKHMAAVSSCYLQAAEHYCADNAFDRATTCQNKAALVGLQARMPEAAVVALQKDDARKLMQGLRSFGDAVVVAECYGLDMPHEWTAALYQQAVVLGDLAYLREYAASARPMTAPMLWDLAKRFETDASQSTTKGKNFRQMLAAATNDHFLRYDIAFRLRMDDVVASLRSSVPGLKYFRK
eukprot:m51a1_g379 hypothetical protein (2180) ;mRNA; r:653024-661212